MKKQKYLEVAAEVADLICANSAGGRERKKER